MTFDEIKIYLPKYLSTESQNNLFDELKDFPENIDGRIYTDILKNTELVYQGDGLTDLLIINLPDDRIAKASSMVLSNTCDISLSNERNFPAHITYAPIIQLEKYKELIIKKTKKTEEQIKSHIDAIKKQEITQIFYLPAIKDKMVESFIFFDRINNCQNSYVDRKKIKEIRLFTLSDYGAYLFLLKLSLHFTRIQDKVERGSN